MSSARLFVFGQRFAQRQLGRLWLHYAYTIQKQITSLFERVFLDSVTRGVAAGNSGCTTLLLSKNRKLSLCGINAYTIQKHRMRLGRDFNG